MKASAHARCAAPPGHRADGEHRFRTLTPNRRSRSCVLVEIDGGVNDKTISQAAKFGVDVCVSGTGVFKASDAKEAIDNLKRLSEV